MGKVIRDGVKFDSQWEVDYFDHLTKKKRNGEMVDFVYQVKPGLEYELNGKIRKYIVDFMEIYTFKIKVLCK